MKQSNNWQQYLTQLLTANGQFALVDANQKAGTLIETYQQQIIDKETIIKVGYLKNERLITLDITNAKTPGHNAEQIEYFYENDFDETKSYGSVGLIFSDVNKTAISSILKSGLQGVEKKYYLDNKHIFSKVHKGLENSDDQFVLTHYFEKTNPIMRLIRRLTSGKRKYEIEEVDLGKIFGGIK